MINPFADVNWRPDPPAIRRFARSLMIGFPILACVWLAYSRVTAGTWNVAGAAWLAGAGFGAGLAFFAVPAIARPFYIVWYAAACTIGLVVANTLLAGAYYLVLTPTGVLKRLAGRRSIEKTVDRSAATYWSQAPPPRDPARYLRQF